MRNRPLILLLQGLIHATVSLVLLWLRLQHLEGVLLRATYRAFVPAQRGDSSYLPRGTWIPVWDWTSTRIGSNATVSLHLLYNTTVSLHIPHDTTISLSIPRDTTISLHLSYNNLISLHLSYNNLISLHISYNALISLHLSIGGLHGQLPVGRLFPQNSPAHYLLSRWVSVWRAVPSWDRVAILDLPLLGCFVVTACH